MTGGQSRVVAARSQGDEGLGRVPKEWWMYVGGRGSARWKKGGSKKARPRGTSKTVAKANPRELVSRISSKWSAAHQEREFAGNLKMETVGEKEEKEQRDVEEESSRNVGSKPRA